MGQLPNESGKEFLEWQSDLHELLKLDEITDEQVQVLKATKISEKLRGHFDQLDKEAQLSFTAFGWLTDPEMQWIYNTGFELSNKPGGYKIAIGVHDVLKNYANYLAWTQRKINLGDEKN